MKIHKHAGFTLIEVMVTVVIIAILAAVAIPAYTEFLRSADRTEAKAVLLENVLSMEQGFTLNNTYGTAVRDLPFPVSPKTGKVKYNLTMRAVTATSYTLIATPVDAGAKCGVFSIDNTGLRTVTQGTVADCWGNG